MKGTAIVWLEILAGLFVIGSFYILFSWVLWGNITPMIYPQLEAINESTSGVNKTAMMSTIDIINIVWQYWPLPLIFGLFLYGVVRSQKREPDTYYYG